MVKTLLESGEDVDLRDQVCRLQLGACVEVLCQLSSWQGIRSKILYKSLIAYLAFVNEFILIGR